jgi:hypothetical protein
VPDHGGQREDALQDSDHHSARGAAVMAFEVELALERLIDRLDDLPQRFEQLESGAFGFATQPLVVARLFGQVGEQM